MTSPFDSGDRRRPRDVLYMAAMAAVQRNAEMAAFYGRFVGKEKKHRVATVAVMRKLVALANALLRDGCRWEECRPA